MVTEISRRTMLRGVLASGAALAASGGAGALLSACSSSHAKSGKSTGPIKIGAITDLTGVLGVVGKSNQAIAQFTVDEINEAGGVLGRKLELVLVDSASDPATAATVARQLVERDRVSMVIGGVTAAEIEAFKTEIVQRGKTLFIMPASYQGGYCEPNFWNVGAVPNQQVDPTVDYLIEQGAKTFFLCGSDYSYPRTELAQVRKRVESKGGRVVGEEYIPVTATDASSLVTKALAAHADAIFEVVILPASPGFIKGVVQGGFKGKIAGTLFDEGANALYGADVQGLICTQDYFQSISDPFSTSELAKFRAKYPKAVFASTFNSAGWHRGIHMWKAAVEKAGSLDLAKVNAVFADGVSLETSFGGPAKLIGSTRHTALPTYLGEMQGNGSVKVIKSLGQIAPQQC